MPRIDEQAHHAGRALGVRRRRAEFGDDFVARQPGRQFIGLEVCGGEDERIVIGVVFGGVHGPE